MIRLFTPLFFFSGLLRLAAATYSTTGSGYWNDPACWQNGQIPPLAAGTDSIFILHDLQFLQPLDLPGATYMLIQSTGSVCGHYQVTIHTGAELLNYGSVNADTVALPGGHLTNFSSGSMIITVFGIVNNGGAWNNLGGSLAVGQTFTCNGKNSGIAQGEKPAPLSIYPNPVSCGEVISIGNASLYGETATIRLVTADGRIAAASFFTGRLLIPVLPPGIYRVEILDTDRLAVQQLIILPE